MRCAGPTAAQARRTGAQYRPANRTRLKLFVVVMENSVWPYDYPARKVQIEAASTEQALRTAQALDRWADILSVTSRFSSLA